MAFKPVLGSPHVFEYNRVFKIRADALNPQLSELAKAVTGSMTGSMKASLRFDRAAAKFVLGQGFPAKIRDEQRNAAKNAERAHELAEKLALRGKILSDGVPNKTKILAAMGWTGKGWAKKIDLKRAVVTPQLDGSVTVFIPFK